LKIKKIIPDNPIFPKPNESIGLNSTIRSEKISHNYFSFEQNPIRIQMLSKMKAENTIK